MIDWIVGKLADGYDLLMAIYFWFACFISIVLLTIYSATRERVHLNYIFVIVIFWIFLEGIGG